MKFSIAGKVYTAVDTQKLSMLDMLVFEQQIAETGRDVTWADVTRWHRELEELPSDKEREQHPAALWVTAIGIWAARRAAGEDLTFAQAINFPFSDVRFIPDTADHKKPAGKARKPRAGSAQGANKPAAASTPSA